MRLRHAGIVVGLGLLAITVAIHARQASAKVGDANAEKRLAVAREGYETILAMLSKGVGDTERDRLSLWSLRILEAQREATGDAVGAAREHLQRMKEYAAREEAAYKAARSPYTNALDGQYLVLEAESILAKAQAR